MKVWGVGSALSGLCGTHLKIPEIKAFDLDNLLLIVPDSAHTQHTPITLGMLHTDIAIKLATKKEIISKTDNIKN